MRITRLGDGVDATGKLATEAIDRTLEVLTAYREVMDELGVRRARLVATSAVRDAVNGEEFLAAATAVVGVPAELLNGVAEGRLAYAGATADLEPGPGDDVVVDIGGGSTELVVASVSGLGAVSLALGCVRLTQRYLTGDPPTSLELLATEEAIRSELARAERELPALTTLRPGSRLLGLAGTVSTLAAMDQGLPTYDRDRLHHYPLTLEAVRRWCATLAAESAVARAERVGMIEGREDVILGGALVLRAFMERFGFEVCLHSESDILDGLVATLTP